jgi:ATP-dependent DNA helicase 2 subunit 2
MRDCQLVSTIRCIRAYVNSIDIDALFGEEGDVAGPSTPSKKNVKAEPPSSHKKKPLASDSDDEVLPPPTPSKRVAKPKHGRLISNEQPIEDFKRITSSGDLFKKAIQDMGAVVKDNVEGSFSRSAFPLAVECLKTMRSTALGYEEVETYNE